MVVAAGLLTHVCTRSIFFGDGMQLPRPLTEGRLVKRYKRFLADVELAEGTVVTAHTPNTGSMQQCAVPGYKVLL